MLTHPIIMCAFRSADSCGHGESDRGDRSGAGPGEAQAGRYGS